MAQAQAGAAYWIDHFVVPTNDAARWRAFMERVLGGRDGGGDPSRLSFMLVGLHHLGGSMQAKALPAQPPLGRALPRYGFYVRREDLNSHLKRLEECDVEFSNPVQTSAHGENGVAVPFRDPDGNEYELWAPDELPPGAMESPNPLDVGRIAYAVLESRNLDWSLEFHSTYLAAEPVRSANISGTSRVLRLAGGGKLVFEQVESDAVTRGGEAFGGPHTAFAVRDEDWELVHERLWMGLPEAPLDAEPGGGLHEPWTRQRGSMRNRGLIAPRGYGFSDWDNSSFHFVRGRFPPGDTVYFETVPTAAD